MSFFKKLKIHSLKKIKKIKYFKSTSHFGFQLVSDLFQTMFCFKVKLCHHGGLSKKLCLIFTTINCNNLMHQWRLAKLLELFGDMSHIVTKILSRKVGQNFDQKFIWQR